MDQEVDSAAMALAACVVEPSPPPMGDDGGAAGASEGKKTKKKEKEEDPALAEKIVTQVEFYFSDINLPGDKFMMDKVKQDDEGFVTIKTLTSFNKMKKLSKNIRVVAEALRTSDHLVVSEDGQRVRRREPLPDIDLVDLQARTVVAENLPGEQPSVEGITMFFGRAGAVRMVRICRPGVPRSTAQTLAPLDFVGHLVTSNQVHALVEFEEAAGAEKAVAELNSSNWRTGLRVRPLVRGGGGRKGGVWGDSGGGGHQHRVHEKDKEEEEPDPKGKTGKGGAPPPAAGGVEGGGEAAGGAEGAEGAEAEEGFKPQKKGRRKKKDYASWASASSVGARQAAEEGAEHARAGEGAAPLEHSAVGFLHGHGSASTRPVLAMTVAGPAGREAKKPDGTQGFAAGRGRAMPPPFPLGP